MNNNYLLYFYVPSKAKEKVKTACFKKGAGKLGRYEHCCFEYHGAGQFRPLKGSQPYLGVKGKISKIKEVKVEMIVPSGVKRQVVKSLKEAHPYEEIAYGLIKIFS